MSKVPAEDVTGSANPIDSDEKGEDVQDFTGSDFRTNRTFFIEDHHLTDKSVAIHNVTDRMDVSYQGRDIEDSFHDKARAATYGKDKKPTYTINKNSGLLGRTSTMYAMDGGAELAYWKHPALPIQSAEITFPEGSPHGSHQLTLKAASHSSLGNEWVQDSVTYRWKCESRWKLGQYNLTRTVSGQKMLIGKYTQNMIKTTAGGVLIVDSNEIDEVVAVLTMCVMLRRMLQRTAGRSLSRNAGPLGGAGLAI